MKLRTFLITLGGIFFLFSTADADVGVGLYFKGGFNLAYWNGEWIDKMEETGLDYGINPGLNAGVGVGIVVNDYFAIQPEVLYSMKGSKLTGHLYDYATYDVIEDFNYLEIPVLFKVIIPAGPVIPSFYIGPSLGFCITAKRNGSVDFSPEQELLGFEDLADTTIDVKVNTKGADFGLALGGSIDIKAGPGRAVIDIRYTLGFLNNYSTDDERFKDIIKKNRVLAFIVGYGIDLGVVNKTNDETHP